MNEDKNELEYATSKSEDNGCFMNRFQKIIGEHTDIPDKFTTAISYVLISETLGRFYKIEYLKDYRPNLYIVLASAPRITRRGSLTKAFSYVLDGAFANYYKILDKDKLLSFEIEAHMLEGGSPQGLIDDINYFRNKGIDSFAIRSTEFGRLFKSIYQGANYMSGMDELLCKLWSGESKYESFSKRGKNKHEPRFLPPNQYFNLLGTMQKAEKYLDDKKVAETGLARRLSIWNIEGEELLNKHKPWLGRNENKMYKSLDKLGKEIGECMYKTNMKLDNSDFLYLHFTDKAKDKFNELDRMLDMRAKKNDDDPYSLFLQGQIDQALKFAMNRAISRGSHIIDKNDFEISLKHAKMSAQPLKPLFERLKVPKKMRDRENLLNKMEKYFKKGLSRSKVQQRMSGYGVHATEFNNYLGILSEDGRINEEQYKPKSKS